MPPHPAHHTQSVPAYRSDTGIFRAQDLTACNEKEKLSTGETITTVGICAAGGAAAFIATPSILTGIIVAAASCLFGALLQYFKEHG